MQLKTYKEYLTMGKELLDAVKLPFKVRKAEKALELRIIELESELADKESKIQEEITKEDVSWDNVVMALDRKALIERKLTQLNDLKEQLFKS